MELTQRPALPRGCVRCGSPNHMVGGCPHTRGKGTGKGEGQHWVEPTGITYISGLAYHDVVISSQSTGSGHYDVASDPSVSLIAIADHSTTEYDPTHLDLAESSDAMCPLTDDCLVPEPGGPIASADRGTPLQYEYIIVSY